MEIGIRNLSVVFPGRQRFWGPSDPAVTAVDNMTFTIPRNKTTVIFGESGCGKTTLVRVLAGIQPPSSGTVLFGGKDVQGIAPKDRELCLLSQSIAFYPHLRVWQQVALWLTTRRPWLSHKEIMKCVDAIAEKLHIESILGKFPHELSGGERQRVAIAGKVLVPAIHFGVKIIFLDEPLSALDEKLRVEIQELLKLMFAELETTIVHVTHNQFEAAYLADTIVVMNAGSVEQVGTFCDIYERPQTKFVAESVGSITMLKAHELPLVNCQDAHFVGIRPQHVHVTRSVTNNGSGIRAEVVKSEFLGEYILVTLKLENGVLLTAHTRDMCSGEYTVVIESECMHFFNAEGVRINRKP
ncbi:MAG: ABC transporter ATP-binding protein [Candidatus Pacebacteria bacterium]|nr:ABC transporter ATP-binding protein [Candidatus Paceibacterota bacterium]